MGSLNDDHRVLDLNEWRILVRHQRDLISEPSLQGVRTRRQESDPPVKYGEYMRNKGILFSSVLAS